MERDAGSSRMVRATSRNVRAPYFFATSRACSRVVTPRLTTHSPPSTRLRVASHSAQRTSARFAALNTAAASRASKMCAYSGLMLAETRTRSIGTGNGKQRGRLREIEEHGGLRRRLGCAHDVDPAEREPLLALVRRRLQRGDERFDLRRIPRGQPLAQPGELRLQRVAVGTAL